MQRRRLKSRRSGEEGVIVMLVAIFLLFVVGAMAALAIDLVTIYTARSEAQQVADAAALAGARVLANSGMTSADPTITLLESSAKDQALIIATQIGAKGKVAGGTPNVTVNFNEKDANFHNNPHVIVVVSRNDLPTYFSRIFGNTVAAVKATATAEAYNPSGMNSAVGLAPPVAPACVKPFILPNLDPTRTGQIFDRVTGEIKNPGLLGWNAPKSPPSHMGLILVCTSGDCSTLPPPVAWEYYPGRPFPDFQPVPSVRTCATMPTPSPYQQSIAGCVSKPIVCNQVINIDTASIAMRSSHTADAVNCLTHAVGTLSDGDIVDPTFPTTPPFKFQGGNQNPIASIRGQQVMVSDSLVTVPVIDESTIFSSSTTTTATVIGFVQLFLNTDGGPTTNSVYPEYPIQTKIINMVGCGSNATGQPILGNGSSPVAVRLVATSP